MVIVIFGDLLIASGGPGKDGPMDQQRIDLDDPTVRAALQAMRRHLNTTAAAMTAANPHGAKESLSASAHEAHQALKDVGLLDLPDAVLMDAVRRLDE
ncbi:hypothetical protein [Streptomyces albireticuli]|uniref:Uncharacterized protein n=1 Tax=Streptomyces albireticuli TaxID=1940 RepID=A0A2A2D9E1_9ACTN|nr:hypothetical protein [Streptomyces albireticuli]MCD9145910.1 hypothetical protein [Streptomyces albireticuli]MCD9166080.1 hypothetical protein [Streptomyces albireticuli]MCD9196360.1 hypothetical protein [Streptomyces albireticuli]PAU47980.1 hypothetical protein CK936_15840 [Streptomyces albireticuli]